uniref:Transcription termination factor 2 n=1 Tax=Nothobranchius furzeri TaxID=105023 RepID=A0A8C6LEJ2_NOTFU
MEKVVCNTHGNVCMLKTGVKDGPSKDKSFYVCVAKQGCEFTRQASISPSRCLHHEESVVELQALSYSEQQLYFRCTVGKRDGQKWCGNVPCFFNIEFTHNLMHVVFECLQVEKEKRAPLSDAQLQQSSSLPSVRNPFKAPSKMEKDSEWRKMQTNGQKGKEKEKKNSEVCPNADRRESCQKENVEAVGAKVEKEEEKKSNMPDVYQRKLLPPGMKIKKKISSEESSKDRAGTDNVMTAKTQEEAKEHSAEQEGAEKKTSAPSLVVHHIKSQTSPGFENVSQKPASQGEPSVQDSATKSAPYGSQQASRESEALPSDEDDDDDVVLVSVKPPAQKTPPLSAVQKTLTCFPGFQSAAKATLSVVNVEALPDKGERLRTQVKELEDALESLSLSSISQSATRTTSISPSCQQGGTILLSSPPVSDPVQHQASGLHLSQGYAQMFGDAQMHAFYGGKMTHDRLLAVKNATCEAIDHLHKSLESCPEAEAEVPDPSGIKVTLMAHQRRALAWLLWREKQNPCGGILADDMGLGKTLTMIALILAKKIKAKEEDQRKEEKKLQTWLSKTDSSIVASKGTLIICPASLIHHWKMEIDRHVKGGKLSVYLYHGPNRERSARVLADYDVVVTTYSLVSKEIPVKKEEPSHSAALLRVAWARVILDEAHNIKNPKVQTSMAVCQLRANARWAMTGTPIQNNLLDMYSLLKFLRCSPFDEYKLWKAQVDNGSSRGRERLNILTRTLLLRRTKDQLDSRGKPLVLLPNRSCEVHQLTLSKEEQAVYDVVFAQSRSTLQNYLKRHEGKDLNSGNSFSSNPFDKVAQEFGMSQPVSGVPGQASSTVHILSLLLRLRQCCCHLSLLKKTLDTLELQGDGIVLSLEEQLNALSLSCSPSQSDSDPKTMVALNGSRFPSQLFEENSQSTKISAIISELMAIRDTGDNQKSVIVSQWTSMLKIVAVHLQKMGLRYAVIDGTVNPKRRMDMVEDFNTNRKGPQVMLLSLCAGGVGLNLTGVMLAAFIVLMFVMLADRFVCEGTVEEKIATLHKKKKDLAQNVLSGTGSTITKLTLADLKIIFGV